VHPDDDVRFFATLRASADKIAPWRVEYRIRTPGGRVKWLLIDAVPERDEGGAITWYGAITDITEAKAMEDELRIAAATFEGHEGIFITDADGVIIRVNHAFSVMTGYSAAEAIGRTPALLKSGRHDDEFYRRVWSALAQDGYWSGEIWNRRKSGELYAEWATFSVVKDGEGRVTHYVAAFSDITEQKQAEERIHRLAFYDPLTNLPNRRLCMDRLEQALVSAVRSGSFGALMFIDLDEFKRLNDQHGHIVGDELLQQAALRLSQSVRASDTVARLGGDEFVVMLEEVATHAEGVRGAAEQARAVATKILAQLAEPYRLEPRGAHCGPAVIHRCTASIGISLFDGDNPGRDELIRQADVAMYAAKAAGRNAIRFFGSTGGERRTDGR
jgi:diguanylate cyclase (GGDEF)-like protein/PAS domain S-box-containing protein